MATILLVVFALVLGAITMSWGKSYVEGAETAPEESSMGAFEGAVIISIKSIDTPLKDLQLKHITGAISEEEYLTKEQELLES